MATIAQWRAAIDAGDLRRVTWVAGDQPVLVAEVVATTRQRLAPSSLDYVSVSGTDEADTWAAANQHPLNPGSNRLVVIRDAEALTRWDYLDNWLARMRYLPGVYLLFVSNEPDLPYVPGTKKQLKPHAAALRAPRGYLVRCTLPGENDAVAWIRTRAPMDEDTARHLLTRTGGDLAAAAAVCTKLKLFPNRAGPSLLDRLVAETPAADTADNLIALNRRAALLTASNLTETDKNKLIALLDSRLDLLHTLNRIQIAGQHWRQTPGVNPFLARRYLPHARHYDAAACAKRRRVLAVIDDALRSGARIGVIEALIALW